MASDAQDLLAYLAARPAAGSSLRVLSGQHVHSPLTAEYTNLFVLPGQLAQAPIVILGLSYLKPGGTSQIQDVNTKAIEHWNAGGVVLIRWAPRNPWTNGEPTSRRVKPSANYADDPEVKLGDIVTPDKDAKTRYDSYLNEVAAGLLELKSAGVVVLFCPLPEVSSKHYWWGQRGRDRFVEVWRYTRDVLVAKGVTNVLWVHEADALAAETDGIPIDYYYPGDDYLDILGHTLFDDGVFARTDVRVVADQYPKVYGFPQIGPRTIFNATWNTTRILDGVAGVGGVRYSYPRASFFIAGSLIPYRAPNYLSLAHNQDFIPLLQDPWVVNRGEVAY